MRGAKPCGVLCPTWESEDFPWFLGWRDTGLFVTISLVLVMAAPAILLSRLARPSVRRRFYERLWRLRMTCDSWKLRTEAGQAGTA